MSIVKYHRDVERLAQERLGTPIYNASMEHAAAIVEHMFMHAERHIKLLSGAMNARIYGPEEVIEQARLFISDTGHKVQIILENPEAVNYKEHPFFAEFLGNDNIELRKMPKEKQDSYKFHVLLMDGDSYRFEYDKTQHVAVAAFGDWENAEKLESLFEVLWARSEPFTPQLQ